jgi:hypothetical protein
MDLCSAAFKQLQEWVVNVKGTANAKHDIDQQIAVLESQLESGLLPAKCRVPKDFTAMIERDSQFQMSLGEIGSSNQTCATVFNDLVKTLVKTEIQVLKDKRTKKLGNSDFLETIASIQSAFEEAGKAAHLPEYLFAAHFVLVMAQWGTPVLFKRRAIQQKQAVREVNRQIELGKTAKVSTSNVELVVPKQPKETDATARMAALEKTVITLLAWKEQVNKGKHRPKLFSSKKNVGKNQYRSHAPPSNAPSFRPSKPAEILKTSGSQAPQGLPRISQTGMSYPESSPSPPTLEIEETHTHSRNHRTRTAYKLRLKLKTTLARQQMPCTHDKDLAANEDVHILFSFKLHPLAVDGLSLVLGFVPSTEPQFSPSPSKLSEAILHLGSRILTHTDRTGASPPFYPPAKINAKMTSSK